jgi:hypothetical protein
VIRLDVMAVVTTFTAEYLYPCISVDAARWLNTAWAAEMAMLAEMVAWWGLQFLFAVPKNLGLTPSLGSSPRAFCWWGGWWR